MLGLKERLELMEEVKRECLNCRRCSLSQLRTQVVFGEGKIDTDIMFIGEAPGAEEDLQGKPFVGKAGRLLTRILESAGIDRDDVYITNVVKCRPPGNRNPTPLEIATCWPFLEAQIAIIKPRIIVTLGSVPTQAILKTKESITKVRGKWFEWIGGIRVFPMFHPSFLLRNQSRAKGSPRWLTWEDIKEVKRAWKELRK